MEPDHYMQSPREELVNTLIHLFGFILALAGGLALIASAIHHGSPRHIISCSIYSATLVVLYFTSTMYHFLSQGRAKILFRLLDHVSIYLVIAGSYTPFTLVMLRGGWGWSLFGAVWGLAVGGIFYKVFVRKHSPWISTSLYLLMGWLVVIAIKPLLAVVPTGGMIWLVAGGLSYTFGVIFYSLDYRRYFHAVWHVFVLGGSVCHFFAIYLYVLPHA
jgi:hemolysin III